MTTVMLPLAFMQRMVGQRPSRCVALGRFPQLLKSGGVAPDGWKFDSQDWWLEEHGLIMEPPQFPAGSGRYLVTGERELVTSLTIHPSGRPERRPPLGTRRPRHAVRRDTPGLPRSALHTRHGRQIMPASQGTTGGISGGARGNMPPSPGCAQQDYAVLIVIGVALKA